MVTFRCRVLKGTFKCLRHIIKCFCWMIRCKVTAIFPAVSHISTRQVSDTAERRLCLAVGTTSRAIGKKCSRRHHSAGSPQGIVVGTAAIAAVLDRPGTDLSPLLWRYGWFFRKRKILQTWRRFSERSTAAAAELWNTARCGSPGAVLAGGMELVPAERRSGIKKNDIKRYDFSVYPNTYKYAIIWLYY